MYGPQPAVNPRAILMMKYESCHPGAADVEVVPMTHMHRYKQDIPDIKIRKATPKDRYALARIIIDATRSAFVGRVPDACLDWLNVAESAANWNRFMDENDGSQQLLVAEVENLDVVALILSGQAASEVVEDQAIATRFPVEITSLQVDPAWHKMGIGRRLVQQAAHDLSDRGVDALMVRVLEDNPNIAFYQALGAERIGAQPYDWEGYATKEVIFGWSSIRNLSNR